jgi:hypothetical protein
VSDLCALLAVGLGLLATAGLPVMVALLFGME